MLPVSFTVYGHPEPQGSTRAFIPKGWKRPVITSANAKMTPWRQQISRTVVEAMRDDGTAVLSKKDGGIILSATFFFARPESLSKKFTLHVKKPDLDKLVRCISDALTGIVFEDDSQIYELHVYKRYGSPERVFVEAQRILH